MTIPQQVLHIFKKDVRQLRIEIGGVLSLAVFLVWLWTDSWSGEANGDLIEMRTDELAGPYVAAVWFLMIARLLHAEPLVGDRHFWLTRPYSRMALLLAKGLFAAAFLLAPLLIAQLLAVSLSGLRPALGALLVNQVAIAAIVCLPAAAVAALTRNLWQYVPLASLGGFAVALVWFATDGTLEGAVPHTVGAILLGGASVGLLVAQYHGRRTLRNAAVYVAACAAVWLLVVAFPRELAREVESALAGTRAGDSMTFGLGPPSALTPLPYALAPQNISLLSIQLPIEVTGADFRDFVLENPTVTLRTAGGANIRLVTNVWRDASGLSLLVMGTRRLGPLLVDTLPAEAMNEPVSLHAEFWIQRYGDAATATLPVDGSAVLLGDRDQCRAIRPGTSWAIQPQSPPIFMCRHALSAAPWRDLVVRPVPDRAANPGRSLFARTVIPTIDPIKDVRIRIPWARDSAQSAAEPTTVALRERVAFFRATLDAENVHLADYVVQ